MTGLKRWLVAIAAVAGIAVTAALGAWQWGRAQERIGLQEAMLQRQSLPALADAALTASPPPQLLHRRIVLRGRWVPERTVFLDNRQLAGRQGFYVVTPLMLAGRGEAVLVQRGWAPRDFRNRTRLPPLVTPSGEVEVAGRLAPPPAKLYAFDADEKGAIRQNLDLAAYRAETSLAILPLSVQQTGGPSEGLLREWPVPSSGADKNYGYAFQWWGLAALIAILYVWFQIIAPRRSRPSRRA